MVWATLLVCLTVLVLAESAKPYLERLLAMREREHAARLTPPARQEAVSIPGDLYALAQAYEDLWAREDALKAMREMFNESGSWDVVRVRYGLPGGRDNG